MIFIYRILTTILYPFLFLLIYLRKFFKKEDPIRFKEKILISHYKVNKKENCKLIWFHAASIGEFKSIIPILKQLNKGNLNIKFLITTTTLSSGNLAKIELKKLDNAEHRYFPLDVPFLMEKFLFLWKPDNIFLVDSEIWPNLILKAKTANIPIAIINARLTSKSFRRWMLFPNTAKKIFEIINMSLCSNVETQNYLKKLNLKNSYFYGNIKLADDVDEKKIDSNNKSFLLDRRFWFAASIHKEEDLFCLNTHLKLKQKFPNIITIIAPRHINRSKDIKSLCDKLNLKAQILSEKEDIMKNKEIIIINYFGALKEYFKYAKSVFIGKSMIRRLKNDGGQNPIEAAKLKCKIYHGPYVYNFEEIYKILEDNKISKKIKSFDELSNNLIVDLEQPKKDSQTPDTIKSLGQHVFTDSMRVINNFLQNDA